MRAHALTNAGRASPRPEKKHLQLTATRGVSCSRFGARAVCCHKRLRPHEGSVPQILQRLLDLLSGVHDKGSIARNGLM